MLRVFTNVVYTGPPVNFQNLQCFRFKRKPLWMPTAKSKLFRVPQRPVIPEDEREELKRLFNNYRTQIKSLRRFLTYRYSDLLKAKSDTEHLKIAFEEDFARCSALNDNWNEGIKKLREERVALELQKDIEFARNRMQEQIEKKKRELEFAEEIVRREKGLAKDFITLEKLDAAIEHAINNPIDYNFAIDLEGNKYHGRETKPDDVKQPVKQ